jgi:hypothetical protein
VTEGPPAPGDSRPRTLARPPGERYGPAPASGGPAGAAAGVGTGTARPALVRASLFGLLTALGIAVLFAIVVGILDLGIGLVALAVIGGWSVGFVTRAGAWPGGIGYGAAPVRLLAMAFAFGAWLAGYFGAYLLSLLLRPDSSLTFGERLAQTSFLDWLSPQLSVLQVLEIGLIVLFALFSSRSASSADAGVREA